MLWVTCFPLSTQLPRKQHGEQCVKHRDKGKQRGFGGVGASFPVGFEDANSNPISTGWFLPAPGALKVWLGRRKRVRVAVMPWSCWLLLFAMATVVLSLLLSTFSHSCCASSWFADTGCHLAVIKLSMVSATNLLIWYQKVWQEHRGAGFPMTS